MGRGMMISVNWQDLNPTGFLSFRIYLVLVLPPKLHLYPLDSL
jgi:hypothetical protein